MYDRYTRDTRWPWPRGLTGVPGSCRGRRLAPPDPGVLRGDMRTRTDRHAKPRKKHSSESAGIGRIRTRSGIARRVPEAAADASAIRTAWRVEPGGGHDTGGDVRGSVGGIGQERRQLETLARSLAGPDPVAMPDTGADGNAGRTVEDRWQEPGRLRRRDCPVAVTHPAPTLSTRPFGPGAGSRAAMTRRAAADAEGGRAPARRPRRGGDRHDQFRWRRSWRSPRASASMATGEAGEAEHREAPERGAKRRRPRRCPSTSFGPGKRMRVSATRPGVAWTSSGNVRALVRTASTPGRKRATLPRLR